jgi:hypothetical protein
VVASPPPAHTALGGSWECHFFEFIGDWYDTPRRSVAAENDKDGFSYTPTNCAVYKSPEGLVFDDGLSFRDPVGATMIQIKIRLP